MDISELVYIAAVIDTQAVIRTRSVHNRRDDTLLPMVALHCPNATLLSYVARKTGTKVTWVERGFTRAGCMEHCPEKHQHIVSKSGRWSVTGAKATVLLCAIRPYLQFQGYAADKAIEVGLGAPKKSNTAGKMKALGWPLPEEWHEQETDRADGAESRGDVVASEERRPRRHLQLQKLGPVDRSSA